MSLSNTKLWQLISLALILIIVFSSGSLINVNIQTNQSKVNSPSSNSTKTIQKQIQPASQIQTGGGCGV